MPSDFSFRRPEARLGGITGICCSQQGLMSLFQSLGVVGLHRRRASVDMLKTCPCSNGIFKKPKICSANCAFHEDGVKHEKPCAVRAFSPKLQAVRTPPPCGKTGTLTLRSRASCLASVYLPLELGPGQLVFDACKFACLCHHRVQERMRLDEPQCKFDSTPMRNLI